MAQQHNRRIGQQSPQKPVTKLDTLRDTWAVMKPFVRFSYHVLRLLAHTLIFIIKHIPKPDDHAPRKSDKVIKI